NRNFRFCVLRPSTQPPAKQERRYVTVIPTEICPSFRFSFHRRSASTRSRTAVTTQEQRSAPRRFFIVCIRLLLWSIKNPPIRYHMEGFCGLFHYSSSRFSGFSWRNFSHARSFSLRLF